MQGDFVAINRFRSFCGLRGFGFRGWRGHYPEIAARFGGEGFGDGLRIGEAESGVGGFVVA